MFRWSNNNNNNINKSNNDDETSPLVHPNTTTTTTNNDPISNQFINITQGFNSSLTPAAKRNATLRKRADGYRILETALEEIGIGPFQQRLLLLTSFGHFVEAAEAQLIGVLLPVLATEFVVKNDHDLALISSLTGLGCMIGSLIFAQVGNSYGRRRAYQISLTLCVLFGIISSFANNIVVFALLRLCLGIGYGGNLIASATLLIEYTPSSSRALYMVLTGLSFGVGAITTTLIAWAVIPVLGWRWLIRIISFISIPVVLALPLLPESARFYVMRGRHDEAVEAMNVVAETNHVMLPLYVSSQSLSRGAQERKMVGLVPWSSLYRALPTVVPLALIWFVHSFATSIFGFIPYEIQKRNPSQQDVKYQVALVMAIGGFCGCFILLGLSRYVGRLIILRGGLLVTTVLTMLLGLNSSSHVFVYVVAFFLEMLAQLPISILYLYTPESSATDVRSLVFGICQVMHRIAPIISPFVLLTLSSKSFELSCMVCGTLFFCSFLLAFLLRKETRGRGLIEDDDWIEKEDDVTSQQQLQPQQSVVVTRHDLVYGQHYGYPKMNQNNELLVDEFVKEARNVGRLSNNNNNNTKQDDDEFKF
jgi:putative MFS transporter